jgi:hypothetical protein
VTRCIRCGRQTKHPRAGLGPVCARKTLGELTKRRPRLSAAERVIRDDMQQRFDEFWAESPSVVR